MSFDLNRYSATGRLTEDPELKYTGSGQAMTKFTLAVGLPDVSTDDGSFQKSEPLYLPVTVWMKMAETVAQYARKGDRVAVDGRLHMNRWVDADGNKRSRIEMTAERVVFLAHARKNAAPKEAEEAVPF